MHSAVRVIKQLLQSFGQGTGQSVLPGGIDQADVEQVTKVHPVFVSKRVELHARQRFERYHGKVFKPDHIGRVRERQDVFFPHLLACDDDVNGVTRFGIGTVQEYLNSRSSPVNEARFFQRSDRPGKVLPAQQHVDVTSVSNGGLIHLHDPGSNSIATHNRVRDSGLMQRMGCSRQTFTNLFHGPIHSCPQRVTGVLN